MVVKKSRKGGPASNDKEREKMLFTVNVEEVIYEPAPHEVTIATISHRRQVKPR